jgi:hypothetical protein
MKNSGSFHSFLYVYQRVMTFTKIWDVKHQEFRQFWDLSGISTPSTLHVAEISSVPARILSLSAPLWSGANPAKAGCRKVPRETTRWIGSSPDTSGGRMERHVSLNLLTVDTPVLKMFQQILNPVTQMRQWTMIYNDGVGSQKARACWKKHCMSKVKSFI